MLSWRRPRMKAQVEASATGHALPGWTDEESKERFAVLLTCCAEAVDRVPSCTDHQLRIRRSKPRLGIVVCLMSLSCGSTTAVENTWT